MNAEPFGFPIMRMNYEINRSPLLVSIAVGLLCAFSVITVYTWPPFVDDTWHLSRPPAWWQREVVLQIGVLLSALPSLAVSYLDTLFRSAPNLRYPVVAALIALETIALCCITHRVVRRAWKTGDAEQENGATP